MQSLDAFVDGYSVLFAPPVLDASAYCGGIYAERFSPLRNRFCFPVSGNNLTADFMVYRAPDCIIHTPATIESGPYGFVAHGGFLGCHRKRFIGAFNKAIVSAVIGLLHACRPKAVIWPIASIYVASLYRKTVWALSHVRKKIGKVMPALTHRYTAPTVVGVTAGAFYVASRVNSFPYFVGFGARLSVGSKLRASQFSLEASARSGFSSKIAGGDPLSHSAVTQDVPDGGTMLILVRKRLRHKPTKTLANNVFHNDSAISCCAGYYTTLKVLT